MVQVQGPDYYGPPLIHYLYYMWQSKKYKAPSSVRDKLYTEFLVCFHEELSI
jgi:hypothetical protein